MPSYINFMIFILRPAEYASFQILFIQISYTSEQQKPTAAFSQSS